MSFKDACGALAGTLFVGSFIGFFPPMFLFDIILIQQIVALSLYQLLLWHGHAFHIVHAVRYPLAPPVAVDVAPVPAIEVSIITIDEPVQHDFVPARHTLAPSEPLATFWIVLVQTDDSLLRQLVDWATVLARLGRGLHAPSATHQHDGLVRVVPYLH